MYSVSSNALHIAVVCSNLASFCILNHGYSIIIINQVLYKIYKQSSIVNYILCVFSKHMSVSVIPKIINANAIIKEVHTGQGRDRVEVKGDKYHRGGARYSQGQSG